METFTLAPPGETLEDTRASVDFVMPSGILAPPAASAEKKRIELFAFWPIDLCLIG